MDQPFLSLQESWELGFFICWFCASSGRRYGFYQLDLSEFLEWHVRIQCSGEPFWKFGNLTCELFPFPGRSFVLADLFLIICHNAENRDFGERVSWISLLASVSLISYLLGGTGAFHLVSGFLTKGICLWIIAEYVCLWGEGRVQGFLFTILLMSHHTLFPFMLGLLDLHLSLILGIHWTKFLVTT